ncbi:MAG TPA: FAD-dependent monooxygenase [Pseudonocardiaceae bacterium]|nr:FAD-dependent monooxygenase [Pseudonocardiaceae bacterium]
MKIVCVGGGPAGLYFAISAKLRNRDHDITVIERNPAGVTYGWGVTFSNELLDGLYRNDPESAREIFNSPASWGNQEVHVRGTQRAHLGGYGFAIGRKHLLDILVKRALALGVDIQFQREVKDLSEFADADLIIACDGANSRVRKLHDEHFQTGADVGRNKYAWLGTHRVFDSFMFAFEETAAGWIWFYSYPFNADTTTFIVECSPETWKGLGFDELGPDDSIKLLEDIFAHHLDGHALMNSPTMKPPIVKPLRDLGKTPWLNFTRITNTAWYHDNIVLMGDAAHTTHFSIGSGTTLAMQDAIGLADSLDSHNDLQVALKDYAEKRCAAIVNAQSAAVSSAEWFENVPSCIDQPITQFAYSLWKRRGHYPLWRYQLHLATQIAALRRLRRSVSTMRNGLRNRRRMKLADIRVSTYRDAEVSGEAGRDGSELGHHTLQSRSR